MTEGAVLIIGGTGFIGSHLVERLVSEGRRVRVASRRGVWPWGAAPDGVDLIALDLARVRTGVGLGGAGLGDAGDDALARALEGACTVVNLAGMLARPGLASGAYDDLHAAGTARLAAAAATAAAAAAKVSPASAATAKRAAPDEAIPGEAGTRPMRPLRLVHVSTTGVLGPTGPTPRDENAATAPASPYETSKLAGERAALTARCGGLEVVVVRPGLVYGPRDAHLAPFYRSIAKGTYRTIAGGRALWQPVYVDDVARAIHLAADAPGCDGEIFHVAGAERLGVGAFAERIAARLGARIRRPGLPYAGAMAAGALLEAVCAPLGIDPPLSRARVRTMTEDRVYAIDRARARLGFMPLVGLDEGIGRAIDWYRDHGYL